MPEIPNGYAQANYRFSGSGLPYDAEVTIGLGVAGFGGTPDEAAQECRDAFRDTILTRLGSGVILTTCTVKYGPSSTGPTGIASGANAGAVAGDQASSAVSYLVRKSTALGGRAGRGRFYLPGVMEANVGSDGQVAAAFRTALQGEVDEYLAALEAALLLPVVLHSADAPISVPTPITGMTVDSVCATQRRRQRR